MIAKQRLPKKVVSRLSLAVFAMFLTWQAVSYFANFLLKKADTSLQSSYLFVNFFNFAALYCIALPVFLLIIRTIPDKDTPEPYRPRLKMTVQRFLILLIFCFGITYIVNFLSTFIIAFFGAFIKAQQSLVLQPAAVSYGGEILSSVFFTACVPGLLEEFVFRYLIYKKMRGSGDLPYIIFSGFAFGMFHGNFSQMFFAIAIGCVYAWIYAKTNVIWYSVGLHFLNNFFAAFILPLIVFSYTVVGIVAILLFVLSAIIVALVLGISKRKKLWAGLSAPSEEGWPEKREKGWQRNLKFRFRPFDYGVQLKTMEYPPYSRDRAENYQIAVYLQKKENENTQTQPYFPYSYNPYVIAQPQYTFGYNVYATQTNMLYYPQQNYYNYTAQNNRQPAYAGQTYNYGNYGGYYPNGYMQPYGQNATNIYGYNPVRYAPNLYPKKVSIVGFLLKNVGSILFIIATIISSIVYLL